MELKSAGAGGRPVGFPFTVPAIATLPKLELATGVTFLVGGNGSGKSTLLEGIAAATGLPTVGSVEVDRDDTLAEQRALGGALRLAWSRQSRKGFFLRAEDFFGFARRLSQLRTDLQASLEQVDAEFADRSDYARALAKGPLGGSLGEIERRYGADLDARSHGESFLALFRSRFVPGGLHLLDEPEAALSPQSQLALLALLGEMVRQQAQFIVATHSPILLALPDARIFSFDFTPVREAKYEELEHVTLTRDFLNDPQRFLRHLW